MKQHRILISALTALIIGWLAAAEAQPIPSSAVAYHFVMRGYLNIGADGQGVAEVTGYITDIPGISDSLFHGSPSEKTSFLTFRSDLVTLTPLPPNGVVNLERVSAGDIQHIFQSGSSWRLG
jgi:hypothetical protein